MKILSLFSQYCRVSETTAFIRVSGPGPSRAVQLTLAAVEAPAFFAAVDRCRAAAGTVTPLNRFEAKCAASSRETYFYYYAMLPHQQNMLMDCVRTGCYYEAIAMNAADFRGKVVVDVGAGSGILSLFAAQAGARIVYAVEASGMAAFAQQLAAANPALGSRIVVVRGVVEEVTLPERADILISEPMGTALVNERMLESFLIARDRLLKPGGQMFPTLGRIHCAPFCDERLAAEVGAKAAFWAQTNFYGVDLTCLQGDAAAAYYRQPVVDAFHPSCLVADPASAVWDFTSTSEEALHAFSIPCTFNMHADRPCVVHGIALWWDVMCAPNPSQASGELNVVMSPDSPNPAGFTALAPPAGCPLHLGCRRHTGSRCGFASRSRCMFPPARRWRAR